MKNLLKLSSIIFILAVIFASCEGPEGPEGIAGTDGMDGTTECMACHNEGTAFKAKQVQFEESAHAIGTYYTRTGECAGCHSTEGFLARMDFTSVNELYDLGQDNQTPIACRTCHNVHVAYDESDWDLTFTDQVTATIFGTKSPLHDSYSFNDYGDGNMCLQCHQARDKENIPSVTSTEDVNISTYWGPHYGVQGNVLQASGGVAIAGAANYPTTTGGHAGISDACISCHMEDGSHTLEVGYDGCIACHTAGDAKDKVEALEEEVHDLLFELGKELAIAGVMVAEVEGTDTVSFHPAGGYGGIDVSANEARAVYNYMVVAEDHSYGVHNPSYIRALLNNTLTSL
jgi:hypothetical protein